MPWHGQHSATVLQFSSSCQYRLLYTSAAASCRSSSKLRSCAAAAAAAVCVQMEQLQADLLAAGQALGAGVQLLLLLTRFRFGLPAEEYDMLHCCLSPVVLEGPEVSLSCVST
jgi:hypothetical protein